MRRLHSWGHSWIVILLVIAAMISFVDYLATGNQKHAIIGIYDLLGALIIKTDRD